MAINKRKILQSAQKNLQKGALDKALKDYTTLLSADPSDANVRLKVGDIHLKQGNAEEAITSYLKVAERFMKDGFDAKAVALYKQITKIDAKRYDVYVPLSELYQRLGLSSDAMKALQTAADAYYRDGEKNQALDLLRKMATFDPSNTTNRLKVAELLRHEGRREEALAEYEEVAQELERQGDGEGRATVLQKILDLDPTRRETFAALGAALIEQKNWSQAEAAAEMMIDAFPTEVDGYELLARVCEHAGREKDLPDVYRRLAEVYKARGDEDRAREIMQRFVSTDSLGGDETPNPLSDDEDDLPIKAAMPGEEPLDVGGDELDDSGFVSDDGLHLGDPIGDLDLGDAADTSDEADSSPSLPPLPPLETGPIEAEEDIAAPEEGDPEQLFAEANVYLRYGKHDRALESLRAILVQDPTHRGALEKLGEALAAGGDEVEAASAFSRAAEAARAAGDDDAFERLRARLAEFDEAAAEALAPTAEPSEESEEAGAEAADAFEGVEIEIDPGAGEVASDAGADATTEIDFDIEDDPDFDQVSDVGAETEEEAAPDLGLEGVEIDIDASEMEAAPQEADLPGEASPPEQGQGEPDEASLEDTPAMGVALTSQSSGSATTPQQIVEDLEEADFYFQQGLYDEAEEVYRRVLKSAPNHPQAMLRLGEIDAARETTGQAGSPVSAESRADSSGTDMPLQPSVETAREDEAREALPASDAQEEAPETEFGMDLTDPSMLGLDDAADFDLDIDEPEEPSLAADGDESAAIDASASEPDRPTPTIEETMPSMGDMTRPMASEDERPTEAGGFDLAAELLGALDGEQSGPLRGGLSGTTEEEGFEQVFAAFKQGVQEELGEGDFEAHYDLGIAYKEMGLLEDAIGEFQIALGGPSRKLASLHAMGLCALDLQRPADAMAHFQQALALPDVPASQQVALRFDLGHAYEVTGDRERALDAYRAVAAVEPGFGDVGERIAALERGESAHATEASASDAVDEIFESFDDLVEEVEPEAAEERYESFDEFLSEDHDEEVEAAAEPDVSMEADPEPATVEIELNPEPLPAEPEAAPEPSPEPKKPGRRKKISFF